MSKVVMKFYGLGARAFYKKHEKTINAFLRKRRKFASVDRFNIGMSAEVMMVGELVIKITSDCFKEPNKELNRLLVPTIIVGEWVFQKRVETIMDRIAENDNPYAHDKKWIRSLKKQFKGHPLCPKLDGFIKGPLYDREEYDLHSFNIGIDEKGRLLAFDW